VVSYALDGLTTSPVIVSTGVVTASAIQVRRPRSNDITSFVNSQPLPSVMETRGSGSSHGSTPSQSANYSLSSTTSPGPGNWQYGNPPASMKAAIVLGVLAFVVALAFAVWLCRIEQRR